MTDSTLSTGARTAPTALRRGGVVAALVGAAGFVGTYLVSEPISSSFAASPAPLPDESGATIRDWIVANPVASLTQAGLMTLSVAFLALFVGAVGAITRPVGGTVRRVALGLGAAAVAAIVVSGALSVVLVVSAAGLDPDGVSALRTANFLAGGTVHVALLGLFVLAASRIPGMSRPVRVLAVIEVVIAVGSLASLGIYYASILILAGRLLGMVWCVVASISLARRADRFRLAA